MDEFYQYETLFHIVFPDLPVQQEPSLLAGSTSESESEDLPKSWEGYAFLLWKVIFTNGLTNIFYDKPKDSDISNISISSVKFASNDQEEAYKYDDLPSFSDDTIHIVPNLSFILAVDPDFAHGLHLFDPMIAIWLQNTETFSNNQYMYQMPLISITKNPLQETIKIYRQIQQTPLLKWLETVELPHLRILGRMHNKCFRLDLPLIEQAKKEATDQKNSLEKQIYGIAGHPFNILSPYEVSDVLFNELSLKPIQSKPSSINSRHQTTNHRVFPPTNSLAMSAIDHPIASLITSYRSVCKLLSNWLAFPTDFPDGYLKPTFSILSTATGRISTSSPNLQNIPSTPSIRSFFLPFTEGYTLVVLDYSQIELRVLAHFSQDEKLLHICETEGIDMHTTIAKIIFSCDSVTPEQREEAKTAIYATIYGKGWTKEGKEKGQKLESVLAKFPKIKAFVSQTISTASLEKSVKTFCGKTRVLPNICSTNFYEKKRDQRMAINTVIQGSAADFMKYALVRIMEEFDGKVAPLLQIHDEWIFETGIDRGTAEFNELLRGIKKAAECAKEFGFSVGIPVKVCVGPNYGTLEEIKF